MEDDIRIRAELCETAPLVHQDGIHNGMDDVLCRHETHVVLREKRLPLQGNQWHFTIEFIWRRQVDRIDCRA